MIARLWHGVTPARRGEEYAGYVAETGVRQARGTPGNAGVLVLRRVAGDQAEFLFASFWDSLESVRRFAGADLERAVYFPRDREFLQALEPTVAHYEVVGSAGAAPSAWGAHDAEPTRDLAGAYRRILRVPG